MTEFQNLELHSGHSLIAQGIALIAKVLQYNLYLPLHITIPYFLSVSEKLVFSFFIILKEDPNNYIQFYIEKSVLNITNISW